MLSPPYRFTPFRGGWGESPKPMRGSKGEICGEQSPLCSVSKNRSRMKRTVEDACPYRTAAPPPDDRTPSAPIRHPRGIGSDSAEITPMIKRLRRRMGSIPLDLYQIQRKRPPKGSFSLEQMTGRRKRLSNGFDSLRSGLSHIKRTPPNGRILFTWSR